MLQPLLDSQLHFDTESTHSDRTNIRHTKKEDAVSKKWLCHVLRGATKANKFAFRKYEDHDNNDPHHAEKLTSDTFTGDHASVSDLTTTPPDQLSALLMFNFRTILTRQILVTPVGRDNTRQNRNRKHKHQYQHQI